MKLKQHQSFGASLTRAITTSSSSSSSYFNQQVKKQLLKQTSVHLRRWCRVVDGAQETNHSRGRQQRRRHPSGSRYCNHSREVSRTTERRRQIQAAVVSFPSRRSSINSFTRLRARLTMNSTAVFSIHPSSTSNQRGPRGSYRCSQVEVPTYRQSKGTCSSINPSICLERPRV